MSLSASLPSPEDLRNLPSRILSSTKASRKGISIKSVVVGTLVTGIALIAGTAAFNYISRHRLRQRGHRVIRAKGGSRREVVVITNVETLEGSSLALSLYIDGFIVFVSVPSKHRADEVKEWGCPDIHAVIVDNTTSDGIGALAKAVSDFLDYQNGTLLGINPGSLSSTGIQQDEVSSSIANISLTNPDHASKSVRDAEAKQMHHDKNQTPLFRLTAVVVNPHGNTVDAIEKIDLEQWRRCLDLNVTGAVVASQKFLPTLRRTLALAKPRRSPRLVFMSSAITGSIGFPYQSAICASHHAIESIADSLRRELKYQGIDVVCLRPGVTEKTYRKEMGYKMSIPRLSPIEFMDPVRLLKESFKPVSTTSALCDAAYDAITDWRPASVATVGSKALSHSFVGWAAPRFIVDWSVKRKPIKVITPLSTKVEASSSITGLPREE
ncbi:hypothetical protein B0O80DRAFT_196872 [Mortierella sp. GBAus27b]|nr:hypothetical protein B0O80DRAFT_196872 [Mortierella sp. GBAus27b]